MEVVLHAHLVEHWDIFHNNSFVQLVVFVSCLLEHEQLVDLLLLHDKVLSRNNSQEFLADGLSHTDNLIWLSGLGLKELNWNLTLNHESFGVENENLINFSDEESIHGLEVDTHGSLKVV